MRKLMPALILSLCLIALACPLAASAEGAPARTVVATDFVCYDFARQVAGEGWSVSLLIDPGTEVHEFEPSPADMLAISEADLFVCIGGESDVWAEDILASLGEGAPRPARLMDAVTPLEEAHGHDGEDAHALEYDEHIWTSPKNAEAMVARVRDELCALDPEGADGYAARAADYIAQIDAIDSRIRAIVDAASVKTLVVADRFPFLYLVTEFGLDYVAAYPTCASEMEPSAKTLAEMIQAVREQGIRAIYTIEMSNGAVARTIAEETGAEILTLHSAQNVSLDDFNAGATYVSLMEGNVEALRKGLE